MKEIVTIIAAILASNALFGFIQFLVTRKDTKKNLKGQFQKLERDVLRTQLLVMISLKPGEQQEILLLGEHYFSPPPKGLDGDWYMTSIFNKWLLESDIAAPDWVKKD